MAKKASINQQKYDKAHCRFYGLKLNLVTDSDIITRLSNVPSMQGYIKQLIRDDIKNNSITEGKTMDTIRIQFESGVSRSGDYGVNYLIAAPSENIDLYAEIRIPDGASDDFGYLALKQEILRQAEEAGIDPGSLVFQYDGQEDKLAPDADGTVIRT